MAYKDHQPLTFEKHMGLYTNYDTAPLPPGYNIECQNMCWDIPDAQFRGSSNRGSIRTREIFTDQFSLANTIVKWYLYTRSTGGRIIYLDSGGNIRDHNAGSAVIKALPGCTNFHGITVNDHFYFTPSNGVLGMAGEAVYVYDNVLSAAARKAAGRGPDEALDPPAGAFAVTVSATAGNIEPGLHVISVSYEYDTGFISKPQIWKTFTAPAVRKRVDLTNVPTGPAGVVARHIWMSHRVNDYDGNAEKVETFFVYKINDNVTINVAGTVDAYDSQLIQSSDPYADLLTEIPAGTFLNIIKGSMVICGSNANGEVLYISNAFEPEAVDSVDGLKTVSKGDGGTIQTTRSVRNLLGVWKSFRSYIIEPNDDVPRLWPDKEIDGSMGAFPQSIGEVLNQSKADKDTLVVANTTGVFPFNGVYGDNLVGNIIATWNSQLSTSRLGDLNLTVDPLAKRIYIIMPKKSTSNNEMFMIDYKLGLSKDNVRISYWKLPSGYPKDMHVLISAVNARGTLLISKSTDNNIATQIVGSALTALELGSSFFARLSWIIAHPELTDININLVKVDICSNGGDKYNITLASTGFETSDTTSQTVAINTAPSIGNQIDEIPFSIWGKVLELGIEGETNVGSTGKSAFQLGKVIAYFKQTAETRVLG